MKDKYIHNKTKKVYFHRFNVWNATNGKNEGQLMACYHLDDNQKIMYVRELEEFYNKFTKEE